MLDVATSFYRNTQRTCRIPLGKPDDDSKSLQTPDGYWKMWNSFRFRLLSDHNSKLLVTLDNLSTMPSDNSLNHWYGEPLAAFIIHTDSFFTRDGDNPKHLSEGIQKLVTYFLNHYTQNAHGDLELVTENDRVDTSKIEPTKAEAETIARGLQTIRNDDLEEVRELGSGTYGAVYHGKWKGSDVAIKRIKASCFSGRPSERARLLFTFTHPKRSGKESNRRYRKLMFSKLWK